MTTVALSTLIAFSIAMLIAYTFAEKMDDSCGNNNNNIKS